jgi:hypothetical protein
VMPSPLKERADDGTEISSVARDQYSHDPRRTTMSSPAPRRPFRVTRLSRPVHRSRHDAALCRRGLANDVSRRWHRRRDPVASTRRAFRDSCKQSIRQRCPRQSKFDVGGNSAQVGFRILEGWSCSAGPAGFPPVCQHRGPCKGYDRPDRGGCPAPFSSQWPAWPGTSPTRRSPRRSQSRQPVSGSALCRPCEPCSADPAEFVVTPKMRGQLAALAS